MRSRTFNHLRTRSLLPIVQFLNQLMEFKPFIGLLPHTFLEFVVPTGDENWGLHKRRLCERYEKILKKKTYMTYRVMIVDKLTTNILGVSWPSFRVWSVGNNLVLAVKGCPFKPWASNLIKGEFLPEWPQRGCPLYTGSQSLGLRGGGKWSVLEAKSSTDSGTSLWKAIGFPCSRGRIFKGVTCKGSVSLQGLNWEQQSKGGVLRRSQQQNQTW